ncbi:hypothetical protein Tco_1214365 [Tanacetum coccineum]
MESSNSNSKKREPQLTQRLVKQRHSHYMAWLEQLETHLCNLYLNSSSHVVDAFKPTFHSFFGEEHQTFRLKMFHNLNQLRLQLKRENLLELQSQDVQINQVQAVDDKLSVSKSSWINTENNNALSTLVNETQLQHHESLVTESTTLEANLSMDVNALDVGLAVTESNRTNSYKQDTSSSSGNYITHVVDADIRPINDPVPSVEVHLTAQHNVIANEQQHTDQSKPRYDTNLLEKVDSNTTPDSTNMSHRGGEIDQDAEHDQVKSPLLKAEFLKTNDMVEKEAYNELSNRFLQLEKHCISLEISIQQKEESFQSNKPCKNQDSPEFREFFKINELKAQLKAKNSTINNLKKQIKNVHEKSNEDNVKHDIDLIKTINIELEHKVAKLLAENERWTPTGRIFKLAGLRWIPTRKMFIDSTTKVDSEPLNVSNKDITNPYEFNQTLNVSAGTLNLSAVLALQRQMASVDNTSGPAPQRKESSHARSVNKWINDSIKIFHLQHLLSHQQPNVDHPVPEVPTLVHAASTSSSSSTTIDQDAPSTRIIPSNLHHLNQSFDTLTKLTKKDPLENVIGDPSRSVSTRSQLQEHAIWCYFDANDNPIPLGGKQSG